MDPDLGATQMYDAVWILADAMRRGGTEREHLRKALLQTRFEGVAGPYYFDAEGNGRHDVMIARIDKGRQTPIAVVDESMLKPEPLPPGSVPAAHPHARLATALQLFVEG